MSVPLYNVLKSSYESPLQAKEDLMKYGYKFDHRLSNKDNYIFYNPKTKKLLHTVAGTKNKADILIDIGLALGRLKHTQRYKDSHRILREAKKHYQPENTILAAHSLGGSIIGYIGDRKDKVITYNKGATIGQKMRPNEIHYRQKNDIVSLFNASHPQTVEINKPEKKSGLRGSNYVEQNNQIFNNPFSAHDLSNLKDKPIFI